MAIVVTGIGSEVVTEIGSDFSCTNCGNRVPRNRHSTPMTGTSAVTATQTDATESPSNTVKTSDFTFGIEIECQLKNNDNGTPPILVGGYHSGRQIDGLPVGWNAQSDASISQRDGHTSVEIVSPVLKANAESAAQIKQVCEWIKSKNGRVDKSCGFHVHIGLGRHLNNHNINKLIMLTQYWQPALYASTGTTRREANRFCKPRGESEARTLVSATTVEAKVGHASDRYSILNLVPLTRAAGKKTIEYRLFAGTVNPIKILAHVQTCLGLAEAACGNISMGSLKWNATGRVAQEMGQGRYASVVREMIRYLWRIPARPESNKGRGIIDPDTIMECKEELNRLAKQYSRVKIEAAEEETY